MNIMGSALTAALGEAGAAAHSAERENISEALSSRGEWASVLHLY